MKIHTNLYIIDSQRLGTNLQLSKIFIFLKYKFTYQDIFYGALLLRNIIMISDL